MDADLRRHDGEWPWHDAERDRPDSAHARPGNANHASR
jgi:hypothetical protein